MRSSYCPDGGAFDRHDSGDSRFLRVEGEEVLYLEAERGKELDLPPNWAVHRSMTAGQVACYLVRRTAGQGQAAT